MSTLLKVRRYDPADIERVMLIANLAFKNIRSASREALGDTVSDLLRPAGDAESKGLEVKKFLELYPENCLVCEADEKIVGFVTFVLGKNKIGTICNNGVDPGSGIRGIGQMMYREVLELFRREGMLAAAVNTGLGDEFAAARHAYEKVGFDRSLSSVTYYMEL